MTSQEFGELIRAQREKKGLTIEEIAIRFKLSPSTLRSIEEGSLEKLPHAVYARGFVRAYAQAVDLDASSLEEGMEALFPQHLFEEVPTPPSPLSSRLTKGGKSFADKLVTLIIVLVGLSLPLAGGWFVYMHYGDDIAKIVKKPFSAMPSSPNSVEPAITSRPNGSEPAITSRPGGGEPAITSREPEAPPAPIASQRQEPELQPAPVETPPVQVAAPVQPNAERAPAALIEGKYVSILGKEPCWVEVTVDDGGARSFTIAPNETSVLPYNRRITIVLGNAGGVSMTHNNKPFPLNARLNEKKTISLQ